MGAVSSLTRALGLQPIFTTANMARYWDHYIKNYNNGAYSQEQQREKKRREEEAARINASQKQYAKTFESQSLLQGEFGTQVTGQLGAKPKKWLLGGASVLGR